MTEDDGIRYTVWRKEDGHSHDLTIDQTRVLDMFFFYMTGYIKTGGNAKRYVFHFRFIQLENKQWKQNQLNREES